MVTPKDVVVKWVDTFNKADAENLANLYSETFRWQASACARYECFLVHLRML